MGNIIVVKINDVWCHCFRKLLLLSIYTKREACVFKNLCFGERFWKDMSLVTVFTKQVSQTGEKNFHHQKKMVTCGKGLFNFNNNLNNSLCTLIKSTKRISIDIYGKNILKLGKLCEKHVRILSHKVARFCRRLYRGKQTCPPQYKQKS